MSMFDYVRCDRLKPGDAEAFQSKELGCELDMLWITDAGRLLSVDRSTWYRAQLQSSERDNLAIYKDLNYNGLFDFDGDLEYRAQFLNGQLIGTWRIEDFRKVYTYEEWIKLEAIRQRQKLKGRFHRPSSVANPVVYNVATVLTDILYTNTKKSGSVRKYIEKITNI